MTNSKMRQIMKSLALFIIMFISWRFGCSQDSIVWKSNVKLKWSDFEARIKYTRDTGAVSVTGISFKTSFQGDNFTFAAFAVFFKKESWVKSPSERSLRHEQGHFDISEIFARKLRQAIKNRTGTKLTRSDLNFMYYKIETERTGMESLYDKETDFSRNFTAQALWDDKIKQQLVTLEAFAQ